MINDTLIRRVSTFREYLENEIIEQINLNHKGHARNLLLKTDTYYITGAFANKDNELRFEGFRCVSGEDEEDIFPIFLSLQELIEIVKLL